MNKIQDWYDDDDYRDYTTINNVIKEVKAKGRNEYGWQNGKIRKDYFVGNIIEFLEGLKPYATRLSREDFEYIMENGEVDNTYNWSAKISNDLDFHYIKGEGCIISVHLEGDVRANYSRYFSIKDIDNIYDSDGVFQSKPINERFTAEINCMGYYIDIYDNETDERYEECPEDELDNILNWIEENVEEDEYEDEEDF